MKKAIHLHLMRKLLFIRTITERERKDLEAGLRSSDAFVLRRCQILLLSSWGKKAPEIAESLCCDRETVRNVINGFNAKGLEVLKRGSSRPHIIHSAFGERDAEKLKNILHQSPRNFGKPTSLWTLELAAEVSFNDGLTAEQVSGETIRATLLRLGVRWKRAKHWISSPDPAYARKKKARNRLIRLAMNHPDWVIGFEDEVWWSRFAHPDLHAWVDSDEVMRLVEQKPQKNDPDPKALACYGLLVRSYAPGADGYEEKILLRFVDGRPISNVTIQFLAWSCEKLEEQGKKALLLIWDNASWHISHEVRNWIEQHNREIKQSGKGVRIISCPLPVKSPWLNPIEPKWIHGKRRVVEKDRTLTAHEMAERVCSTFGCVHGKHLTIAEKVS